MPRANRIQQIYGYLVCLIAIITLLVSTGQLIGGVLDLNRPKTIGMSGRYGDVGDSYGAYRINQLEKVAAIRKDADSTIAIPSDSALRVQYDQERNDREVLAHWDTTKTIITSTVMIILAIILFMIHWRWLRGFQNPDADNG